MAWSRLQSASHTQTSSAASVAVTFGSNLSLGTKIICAFAADVQVTATAADGAGNSLTSLGTVSGATGGNVNVHLFAMDTPPGDVGTTPTITVSWTGNATSSVLVQEIAGLATGTTAAVMLDGAAATAQETPSASQAQPAYRSSTGGEYLISILGDNGNSVTYALAGYTLDANSVQGSATADIILGYKSSTGGAESGTWTTAGTPTGSGLIVVAMRLAAIGPLPAAPGQTWLRHFRPPTQQAVSYTIIQPPAPPVTGPTTPLPPALPGQTWLRQFRHQQQPVDYTIIAPSATPAPLYPLAGPVKAKLPSFPPGIAGFAVTGGGLPVNQSSGTGSGYGRVFSSVGIFYGSVIYPPAGPVTARYPQPQLHGRVVRNAGAFSGTGPAVKSLQGPVTARRPQPQLSGRALGVQHAGTFTPAAGPALTPLKGPVKARPQAPVLHGRSEARTGTFSGSGPAPKPLVQPATARLPAARTRGYATSRAGVFTPPAPPVTNTGSLQQPAGTRIIPLRTGHVQALPGATPFFAHVTPLQGPVTIHRTLPPRGRIYGIVKAGPSSGQGPAHVYRQRGPVAAVSRPLPLRGHGGTQSGIFAGVGPPVAPLLRPIGQVRAQPLPVIHGRAMAIAAIPVSFAGVPVPPLPGPVAVTLYPVRTGWTIPGLGLFAGIGPAVYPQHGPVKAELPPFPFRKGRHYRSPAAFSGTGSPVAPLRHPVKAQPASPVLHGRFRGSAGTFTFIAPGSGPALSPWHAPVTARQPLPVVHGRAMAIASLPVQVTAIPASVYPLQGPVGIGRRAPGPVRYGRVTSNQGAFAGHGPAVTPLTTPVRTRVPVPPFSKGRGSGSQGTPVVIVPAPLYPLTRPVRAPLPGPFLHGRAISRKGAFSGTGPAVKPLTSPVSIHHPLPPQGRVIRRAGTFTATGSPVPPRTGPVTARRPQPTRYGRGNGSPGRSSGTGPATRPLGGPVRSRPPLGPRGHGGRNAGLFTGTGPAVTPLTRPVRARQPLPPAGKAQWRIGGPFVPPPPVMAPPATLYLTPATITQAPPYAATTVTGTGSLLTISTTDSAMTVTPATEGIRPVQVGPVPDAEVATPDPTTLFPDLPG